MDEDDEDESMMDEEFSMSGSLVMGITPAKGVEEKRLLRSGEDLEVRSLSLSITTIH